MNGVLTEKRDELQPQLTSISEKLYHNPELGNAEFQSMQLLVDLLAEHGFAVETNIVNRPTAFKAVYQSTKPGPVLAYLAEYDALPEVGHGCGHNMIGTMSAGAAIVLSQVIEETGGTIMVLGTPAEETNGAKVDMSQQGIFQDVDVAMMLHPSDVSYESGKALAMDAVQFAYYGQSSHAAAAPEEGINALDSVIQLFNGINAYREHVTPDVRIHGVIAEGGRAANVVPDQAIAQFYIRAAERTALDGVVNQVKSIAEGAALMTGARLEVSNYELSYDNMVTNHTLSDVFTKNLQTISAYPVHPPKASYGSMDMGDVSRVVPAIHPMIGLQEPGLVQHTEAFADKTITEDGHQALADGVLALAQTGYDVLADAELLAAIKQEFNGDKEKTTS